MGAVPLQKVMLARRRRALPSFEWHIVMEYCDKCVGLEMQEYKAQSHA